MKILNYNVCRFDNIRIQAETYTLNNLWEQGINIEELKLSNKINKKLLINYHLKQLLPLFASKNLYIITNIEKSNYFEYFIKTEYNDFYQKTIIPILKKIPICFINHPNFEYNQFIEYYDCEMNDYLLSEIITQNESKKYKSLKTFKKYLDQSDLIYLQNNFSYDLLI